MKALVLLSQGLHPVSGKACVPRVEAQAARLAVGLDADAGGLHAGPSAEAVREALGRGLTHLTHVKQDGNPIAALVAALGDLRPDVALGGFSGQGGEDTGFVPYALAHALGWPLVAHAVAVEPTQGGLRVTQALPKGARRFVLAPLPVLVTTHRSAPPPLPFAYARARAGRIDEVAAAPSPPAAPDGSETRPYRARPKAFAHSVPQGAGRLLVNADPQAAAREILAFLRSVGVVCR